MHTESAPNVQQSQYNLSVLSANGPNRFHFVRKVLFLPSKFNASKTFFLINYVNSLIELNLTTYVL